MTDKEKLKEIKKLADAMYHAAQYITTDASRLHKAMEEYHQFIIHEYYEEEPAPKIFEDMLNAKTPAESLGISAEEHDKIIDLCLYGKESEMVDIDDLPKEEPVSEDIDKAAFDYMETKLDEVKDRKMFLSNFFGSDVENAFKAGAQRQKIKDSEEIKLIRGLLEDFDKHCDEYHEAGFKHGQEAMMKDATDVIVHIDAGGYPYIPQMELYDYDKDVLLAKEGDKYKVILIKEDQL